MAAFLGGAFLAVVSTVARAAAVGAGGEMGEATAALVPRLLLRSTLVHLAAHPQTPDRVHTKVVGCLAAPCAAV